MSARISLEQPAGIQGQWKQQGKTQNQSQANPSINYSSYNSNNIQNSINSIMTNYNSINQQQQYSPYTQASPLQPLAIPISLSLAAGNDQNVLTKYGFQALNQTTGKVNEQNSIGNQITGSQLSNQNINQQNLLSQNYIPSSQNGVQNINITSVTSTFQSSTNYYSNMPNGSTYNNSHSQQSNLLNNNNMISNIVVSSSGSSQNNVNQYQSNINPSYNSSLNQTSNFQSSGNQNIGGNTSPNVQNNNNNYSININNPQSVGISSIKIKNIVRSSGELKDKAFDQGKQNELKENKSLQEKSPTTLGEQINETLITQQNQTQSNSQNIQPQQQLQNQSQQSQQQQYSNIISQFYSQNPSSNGSSLINNNFSNLSNYNSVETSNQNNEQTRINHHSGSSSNKNSNYEKYNNTNSINNQNAHLDNNTQSINSSRYSSSNYSSNLNNGAVSNSSSQQLQQNSNTRNSGVRNHTLERSDNSRSGNLNTKVQNSFIYNKGNNALNSSSGAASSSSTVNQNSTNNNLFRKSLEYNQSTQLSGISALNLIPNNNLQSTNINLYSSSQQPSQQASQNQTAMNLNKTQNLKSSNTYNIYSKEANQIEQNTTDSKFTDFYNKTKSPRDQIQSIYKVNKEKSYNITDYEAMNQQNQQQFPVLNTNQTSQMRQSQNSNNQFLVGSFTNFSMKTYDASQNVQGYTTTGLESGSRSLERQIQPSSSKNGSSTNLSQKYFSYNQGKLNQGLQSLQSEQALPQKYNGRQGHHISTISHMNKHQKTSRSNTPIKSSTNSNYISPNPSFLGVIPGIALLNLSQLSGNNNLQLSNMQQQLENKPNLLQAETNLMNKGQLSPNYQGYKKQNEQNQKISPTNSTDKIQQIQTSKQYQTNYHSNHNQSLAGQIVQISNTQQTNLVQKLTPRSSQNLQNQSQKNNQIISPISQINQVSQIQNVQQTSVLPKAQIFSQVQPNNQGQALQQISHFSQTQNNELPQSQSQKPISSSNNLDHLSLQNISQQFSQKSPQIIKDKIDNQGNKQQEKSLNIDIYLEEKSKSQTIISPLSEKVGSNNNFEYKSLASRYNHDAIQNFLENQNARISTNMQSQESQQKVNNQIEKVSTSNNKQNQQQISQTSQTELQNPSISNLNTQNFQTSSASGNNNLFISSNLELNNQFNFEGNNTRSKSKSPVNQQKTTAKLYDFSQIGSSNQLDSSSKISSNLGQKFTYKPLNLKTEESNPSIESNSYNQLISSKSKNTQSNQNKEFDSNNLSSPYISQQQVHTKQPISNEDKFHLNQIQQQQYQNFPSSQQILEQSSQQHSSQQQQQQPNQARSSFNHGTTNQLIFESPYTQNIQNKSIDKNSKKPSNSNMRLYSDNKSLNNLSTKSPKSANNNSFLQQIHQQAYTTSSNVNDNSIPHSNQRLEQLDQYSTSAVFNTQSPFTIKQTDEQLTPSQTLFSVEGGYKTNGSLQNDNSYQNIPQNLYKNNPQPPNTQVNQMMKIKEKMKKTLESHTKKENLLQNENQELKNQITKLKQTISNQQGEIIQLKSQLNQNNQFLNNNNNNQLQMSFQNLFNQDYSATKNQLSPRSTLQDVNQVFQSPLEISFQQHQ